MFARSCKLKMTAVAIILACVDESSFAQDIEVPIPDATLTMSGNIIALGIGYVRAHGTLNYRGQTLSVCARGVSLGELGVAHIDTRGVVYGPDSIDQFASRYVAVSAGAAIAHGESAAELKNEHGVIIELESKVRGVRFNLAVTRLRITFSPHDKRSDSDG